MKTLRNIAMTIGLAAVLGSATLFAQTASKANIPFDFQMTGQTMPAGQYIVTLANRQMLVFQNVATGRSNVTLVHGSKSGARVEPILTFRHSGERYKLDSAWFAGVEGGYSPLQGKRDRADGERGVLATIRLLQK
jgi:hypothetical protein